MSDKPEPSAGALQQQQRKKRGLLPPEIIDLMVSPIKVGTWSGAAGVMAGVAGAIARDTNPVFSGAVTGFQWFALGGSFWFTRSVAVRTMGGDEQLRPVDRTMASTIGGSAAGAVAGLIRKILPAMAVWGVVGAGGQMIANGMSNRKPKVRDENDSWLRSRWSPLKKLTDQEYIDMMDEKILRVDADIALIDDRIAELRAIEQSSQGENRK
ncbi:beta-ketoacyl synthase [Trichoderma arundinaceum]|uniref:Beta-ketoacyl synthase n=1 Tax=Trichoderma arundinaceum TaxID=490622 RepID=A0A395NIE2_TRIAR|nr:beta-ketoacyl synthase [Trichoderma arundinaceum]